MTDAQRARFSGSLFSRDAESLLQLDETSRMSGHFVPSKAILPPNLPIKPNKLLSSSKFRFFGWESIILELKNVS